MLQNVQPIGEHSSGFGSAVRLPEGRSEDRRNHAGEGTAPSEIAFCECQSGSQLALREQSLALPKVGEPDYVLSPARGITVGAVQGALRRTLKPHPGTRRFALEEIAIRRHAVKQLRKQRITRWRRADPEADEVHQAVRIVGEGGRS